MERRLFVRQRTVAIAMLALALGGLGLTARKAAGNPVPAEDARRAISRSSGPSAVARSETSASSQSIAVMDTSEPLLKSVKKVMVKSDWRAFDREWCELMGSRRTALEEAGGDWKKLKSPRFAATIVHGVGGAMPLRQQHLKRVAKALSSRPTAREQAVGLWLMYESEQLMAMAEATRDPMIVALAAQLNGESRKRAVALWRTVEPDNLAAMVHAQLDERQANAHWFEVLKKARHFNTYVEAAFRIAQSVPPPTKSSPSEFSLQTALWERDVEAYLPQLLPLFQPCQAPDSEPMAQQCAQLAERLWASKPKNTEVARLSIALIQAQPWLHTAWNARAQQVEAVEQLKAEAFDEFMTAKQQRRVCMSKAQSPGAITQGLSVGDWVYWSARLRADPAGVAALSSRYRQSNKGKGLLSHVP
jgi:hypothetical protein